MKIKLKIYLVSLFCLIGPFLNAQSRDTVIKGTDPNSIEFHKKNGGKQNKLKFKNKEFDINFDKPYISAKINPDGTKAAVIKRNQIQDTINSIILFDKEGNELRSFPVIATKIINYNKEHILTECVFNEGNIYTMFTVIRVFDETGKKISSKEIKYGTRPNYYYSKTGKIVFSMGYEKLAIYKPRKTVLYFFDDKSNLIGESNFDCFTLGNIIEINEENSTITIQFYSGNNYPGIKETIIIDFGGTIKERRQGWEK